MPGILFSPWTIGKVEIKNRAGMAPMTRSRCPGNSPGDMVATYYTQREDRRLGRFRTAVHLKPATRDEVVGVPRCPGRG
jgi:2,4-dienoyl-CoA reductase-like NADH-dependent reductase (Old Yellow Enzyme family)